MAWLKNLICSAKSWMDSTHDSNTKDFVEPRRKQDGRADSDDEYIPSKGTQSRGFQPLPRAQKATTRSDTNRKKKITKLSLFGKRKNGEVDTYPNSHLRKTICHSCRSFSSVSQRMLGCSQCKVSFCSKCLETKHGENVKKESEPGLCWVCPKCRGGCGAGCNQCCVCSKCRLKEGLQPVGHMIPISKFNNVHDYLVHLQTNESPKEISKRKKMHEWTKAGCKSKNLQLAIEESHEEKQNFDCDLKIHNVKKRKSVTCDYMPSRTRKQGKKSIISVDHGLNDVTKMEPKLDIVEREGTTSNDPWGNLENVEMFTYLMKFWLEGEKTLVGNQLCVILDDKALKQANAIKNRSFVPMITSELNSPRFMRRPKHEQASVKESMKNMLQSNSLLFKNQFGHELDVLFHSVEEKVDKGSFN